MPFEFSEGLPNVSRGPEFYPSNPEKQNTPETKPSKGREKLKSETQDILNHNPDIQSSLKQLLSPSAYESIRIATTQLPFILNTYPAQYSGYLEFSCVEGKQKIELMAGLSWRGEKSETASTYDSALRSALLDILNQLRNKATARKAPSIEFESSIEMLKNELQEQFDVIQRILTEVGFEAGNQRGLFKSALQKITAIGYASSTPRAIKDFIRSARFNDPQGKRYSLTGGDFEYILEDRTGNWIPETSEKAA